MNFATWCAVSTEAQAAEDKVSLEVQRQKCTQAGLSRGWRHVRDYIVPGESRSAYASLYHAEKHIPQLHDLLEAASRHEFDLLIVYDLNRFRSLMRQVFDVLCDYNVQLYILSDPRDPVPPAAYTPEIQSAVGMIVDLRGIISKSEIDSLKKHFRDKMPRRVTDKGLHPGLGAPPYGYRKPPGHEFDPGAVLVQVPEQVTVLYQMRDWLFEGHSLTGIARRLNDAGLPSPRGRQWRWSNVRYMLSNSFYAGRVQFGKTRRQVHRRDGRVTRLRSTPITATGRHVPIWDDATHQAILDEIARRTQAHPGGHTHQLSRLLHCGRCGRMLHAAYLVRERAVYWRCSSRTAGHVSIYDRAALPRVVTALQTALANLNDLPLSTPADERPALESALRDLRAKRKRWMDAYEDSALDLPTLTERLRLLDGRIATTLERIQQTDAARARSERTRQRLGDLAKAVETLPRYLLEAPPAQVNADLRSLLESITVNTDKTVTLNWR